MLDHTQEADAGPLLVADHLALDLLNTQARSGDADVDFWQSGDDVRRWLERCGIAVGQLKDQAAKDDLLEGARQLRASARELVELRKQGRRGKPERLNRFLATMQSVPVLEWNDAVPVLVRRLAAPSPRQALGRLAESVADLLATGQFEYVRQCEHPDCVLWFYDRTKSHRRRWCSMALCGNRHKAAEFRKRGRTAA